MAPEVVVLPPKDGTIWPDVEASPVSPSRQAQLTFRRKSVRSNLDIVINLPPRGWIREMLRMGGNEKPQKTFCK